MLLQCCNHQLIRLTSSSSVSMAKSTNDSGITDCILKVTLKQQLPCYNQHTQFAFNCEFYKNSVSRKTNSAKMAQSVPLLGYELDNREIAIRFPARARDFFLFFKESTRAEKPAQSSIQWVDMVLYSKVKLSGRANGHKPPSIAEVENEWSCNSTPLCLH